MLYLVYNKSETKETANVDLLPQARRRHDGRHSHCDLVARLSCLPRGWRQPALNDFTYLFFCAKGRALPCHAG